MAKDEKNKKNNKVKEHKSSFFKESKSELKKVIWPSPKNLFNDTTTVVGIVLIVAIIVVMLDFIFLNINENVILKAEENIKNSKQQNTVTTDVNALIDQMQEQQNEVDNQQDAVNADDIDNANNTDNTNNAESNAE